MSRRIKKCPKCGSKEIVLSDYNPRSFSIIGLPEALIKFVETRKAKYYICYNCLKRYILIFPNGDEYLWDTDVKPLHWKNLFKKEQVIFT